MFSLRLTPFSRTAVFCRYASGKKDLSPEAVAARAAQAAAEVDAVVQRVRKAQAIFEKFDQASIDRIVEAVAVATVAQRIPLAQFAHKETGRGVMEDKVIKNHFSSENVCMDIAYCGLFLCVSACTC